MSFYDERNQLRIDLNDELLNFDFLVNVEEGDASWFLHGCCYVFAAVLKLFNPSYTICYLMDNENPVIHVWCRDIEGNFIDIRGKTSDIKDFFDEFEDWYDYQFPNEDAKILEFESQDDYLSFIKEKLKIDFSDSEWVSNRDISERLYHSYKEYYEEVRDK